jgi:hypothetical protein
MNKAFSVFLSQRTAAALFALALLGTPLKAQMSLSTPAPGQTSAGANLSQPASEVVKIASAGTGEDVILAFIQNAQSPFALSADNVLYLKDLGISSQVVAAMLNRDQALRAQAPNPYAPAPFPSTAESAPPPPAPAADYVTTPPPDVTYFYNDLSPYGAWVVLPGYGWCWQPTVVVVNRGWRPYCDGGHWIYSDAGWCWVSDYSWGWGPFHYGRWYCDARCGWVWVPDRVWGPAWVTWRVAGDHCGWAPLPPRSTFDVRLGWCFNGVRVGVNFDYGLHADVFTFVSFGNFCDHDLHHHCLAPTEVTHIYKQTTIINNYTVQNNIIVNQGVKVERVAAATHTQIHKAVIRDLPAGSAGIAQAHGWEKSGLVVYRPQLKAPAKPVNMVAQKVDEHHPVIHHTTQQAAFAGGNERISNQERVNTSGNSLQAPRNSAPVTPAPPYRAQPEKPKAAPTSVPQQTAQQHTSVPKTYIAPQPNQVIEPKPAPHNPSQPGMMSPQSQPAPRSLEQPNGSVHVPESVNANSPIIHPPHEFEPTQSAAKEQGPQYSSKQYHQNEAHPHQSSNPHSNQQGQGQPNGKDSDSKKKDS